MGSPKIFNDSKSLKIINVGRIVDQKDQLTMIKALRLIKKNIKFEAVIVGKGVLKNNLIEYTKKHNIDKKIKFINFKSNVYPLIKQADIFILSSTFEGLPNVLLEATALNKFIISSNCPTGPKEILLNGKGGLLFKVGDYKGLKKKIIYYFNNKKKCKLMLNNSIQKLDRFDENLNLKKYLGEVIKLM
jgi:glycosyltransferase involved in cell wall biosynthesis